MATLTAHCLLKNEENFIGYAIKSVIDFVDYVLVFDTGSTDKTVEIIQGLAQEHPGKIIFEEKGACDFERHTHLRQEMIERTKTDWFMILDGDEVWPRRAIKEAKEAIGKGVYDGIKTHFYECVGDIYHKHYKESYITLRFVKVGDVYSSGNFIQDNFYTKTGEEFLKKKNIYLLRNRYWHLTHLERSSLDNYDYSSGGTRIKKRRLTYFLIGRKINENAPEVFEESKNKLALSKVNSLINFVSMIRGKN
ncbi:MAG: glycosyltransferase [Patescibacteria group bacterium]